MSYWRDKECPTNSRDAYWEGRRSEDWQRNPYEHGRDAFADRECREAHDEWQRGHRAAEYEREEHEREQMEERRAAERREHLRQEEEAAYQAEQERAYYAEMERQHQAEQQPE